MLLLHLRRCLAFALVLSAAFAVGCGDDERGQVRLDATLAGDVEVDLRDGQLAEPDSSVGRLDTPPIDGRLGLDATRTDAPGQAEREPGRDAGTTVDAQATPSDAGSSDGSIGYEAQISPLPTLVVLPDTQYYAAAYPEVFAQQTAWILAQRQSLNIRAVLHVGDLVDDANSPGQWAVAKAALRPLDNVVPYLIVPGNHDTDGKRQGLMNSTFAPATMPWIAGTMDPGQIDNSYAFADVGGTTWLLVGLEFGPRDAAVAWADAVLKAYPTTPAIIVTHAYLYRDGTRYDVAKAGVDQTKPSYQYFYPAYYGYTADQGINDGEMLWQKLVLPNPNVRLVFSGHDTGGARLRSTRPDGSVVHQMLSDYQWLDDQHFGFGYLRILRIDYDKETIDVQTYSPYLHAYKTDADNQFTLDLYD